MADKIRGKISVTPLVTVADDADANGKDVIHHDIKKTLGGEISYELKSD